MIFLANLTRIKNVGHTKGILKVSRLFSEGKQIIESAIKKEKKTPT